MEKIKVNENVKNDLDYMLSYKDKFFILNKHINEEWSFRTSLNSLSVKEISKALNFGYELEKTPEEELLEIFENLNFEQTYDRGLMYGVEMTLNKLNIKIKGINA